MVAPVHNFDPKIEPEGGACGGNVRIAQQNYISYLLSFAAFQMSFATLLTKCQLS